VNAGRRPGTLPIRRWLALALLITFLVPVCTTVIFAVSTVRGNPHDKQDDAIDFIRDESDRWTDPVWQQATAADLANDDVAFVLIENGNEIYRSTADPLVGNDGEHDPRTVKRITIDGSDASQVAYVYADEDIGPPDELPVQFLPLVVIGSLALTLTGIAYFFGRTMLRPLAATSRAARQIADGDLDISLPKSRVREVAEVSDAFESMSAALRNSLEEQAEQEQERRLFIGAVAHDLRTPLFALRGYLEGIESGVASTPEQQARYLGVAREKADALELLISDLFDFSRLEYLDQAPNREPLDLAALFRKLVDGIQPRATAKSVTISVETGTDPCTVDADSHLLTRAIENLLDNALRFTPNGGTVRVTCAATQTGITFSIADSGPGIAAADLPNLFAPLYRGESSRNRRTGGAGLGLTIARRILLAHDGDLTAANRSEGGAVFIGTIPATI
jgi:signal transduction histidine kinase